MKTILDVITEAKNKLQYGGWTQGSYAKDVSGKEVDSDSKDAKCWCSVGALEAAMADDFDEIVWAQTLDFMSKSPLLTRTSCYAGDIGPLVHFNDSSTFSQVMQVFEERLAAAQLTLPQAK